MPADYKINQVSFQGLCSGSTGVPINSTRYLGHTTFNVQENMVTIIVPTDGHLSRLHARSNVAPGAGETFTYTIMIQGNPSASTVQIADALDNNADLVNVVAVAAGDTLSIRLVTSLNAAVTIHHIGYQFER